MGICIKQIPIGHGITNINHFGTLTKKVQRQAETTQSVLYKDIRTSIMGYKMWAVVSQNVLDTIHGCIDLLLKCDCGVCLC